jgi:hypothetical protein
MQTTPDTSPGLSRPSTNGARRLDQPSASGDLAAERRAFGNQSEKDLESEATSHATPSASEGASGGLAPGDSFSSRFKGLWKRLRGPGNPPIAEGVADDSGDETDAGVVHSITRKTDYWFDRQVFELERDARHEAASWAAQGLPRHDLDRVDPLEIELVLAGRCVEIFRQWVGRVRVKMRDAIAAEAERIGMDVSRLQATTDRLVHLHDANVAATAELAELDRKDGEERPPLGFEPMVRNRMFFPSLAVILVAVEFLANFPLFRLLLPLHTAMAGAAQDAATNVGDQWWAGLALWGKLAIWHVEALVVTLAAVIVLVVFGKSIGKSARVLLAFRAKDHPTASGSIRSSQRQSVAVVLCGCAGAGLVIAALFLSRGQIAAAAAERVSTDSTNVEMLRTRVDATRNDIGQVASLTQQIRDANRALGVHRDDYGYAQTVQSNNVPITLLNIGLVLAAALVGYLASGYKLANQFGADPRMAELRQRRAGFSKEAGEQLARGYECISAATASIGRVEHMIRASPLDEWPAKARRLSGIIPLFRGDNARLRGMDSASILSFRQPPPLELPIFEAERGFPEPTDFAALKETFVESRQQFYTQAGAIIS